MQVDKRLIPMLAALYLIAHLDRSNIGNTKVSCRATHDSDYEVARRCFSMSVA